MSSDARISEIRARLEKATPGDWEYALGSGRNVMTAVMAFRDDGSMVFIADCLPDYALSSKERDHRPDMEFIANAPADIAHLLERVAALEVERDGLRGWQNGQTHYVGCWREHRQCALTTIDFEGARRERAELALREAVAELNRLREGQEP